MFGTTALLTVGHALQRALDEELDVRINVGGEWITGRVVGSDGHGVAVAEPNGDLCVVRSEAVVGVRLPARVAPAPSRQRVHSERTELPRQPQA